MKNGPIRASRSEIRQMKINNLELFLPMTVINTDQNENFHFSEVVKKVIFDTF